MNTNSAVFLQCACNCRFHVVHLHTSIANYGQLVIHAIIIGCILLWRGLIFPRDCLAIHDDGWLYLS